MSDTSWHQRHDVAASPPASGASGWRRDRAGAALAMMRGLAAMVRATNERLGLVEVAGHTILSRDRDAIRSISEG